MIPSYWQDALAYLTRTDEIMARLIASYADEVLTTHDNPFETLLRAVVGQQISVKAAAAVWQRLQGQLEIISPSQLLRVGEDDLRHCGLSRQKISYLRAIARAFESGTLTPSSWKRMSDHEVVSQLVRIRGIGQWTAEMFLIFHLHRKGSTSLARSRSAQCDRAPLWESNSNGNSRTFSSLETLSNSGNLVSMAQS